MKKFLLILSSISTALFVAQAEVVKIELPPETTTYKPGHPGVSLANAQCLTCHSTEYVALQPPMPRTYWKDSVDKMISLYGAPVPTEQIESLVDYLARVYGTDSTNTAPIVATPVKTETDGKIDVEKLAKSWGCIACHVDQPIGPAYKEVAKKYKGNPEGMTKVIQQIENGGVGQWGGSVPMPPFTDLSTAEKKALAEWVLSQ